MVDDDELMTMLGEVLAPELTVPPQVLSAARQAFVWRRIDEELAELLFDSADEPVAAGLRGGAAPRQVSYASSDLLIECELGSDTLVGQLLPADAGRLELLTPTGRRRAVEVDPRGRFVVEPVPSGPIRLCCGSPSRSLVLTPWLLV